MISPALMSSARQDWCTPAEVVELLHVLWDGPPDLDPCGSPESVVDARIVVLPPSDGLGMRWHGRTYVNPPFAELDAWSAKCAQEGEAGVEVILLLPARTDTAYWHAFVSGAAAICFWRGRMRFLGAPSSAPFPTALAYWGPRPWDFQRVFRARGMVVAP